MLIPPDVHGLAPQTCTSIATMTKHAKPFNAFPLVSISFLAPMCLRNFSTNPRDRFEHAENSILSFSLAFCGVCCRRGIQGLNVVFLVFLGLPPVFLIFVVAVFVLFWLVCSGVRIKGLLRRSVSCRFALLLSTLAFSDASSTCPKTDATRRLPFLLRRQLAKARSSLESSLITSALAHFPLLFCSGGRGGDVHTLCTHTETASF